MMEILEAVFKLGMPVAGLSWFMFSWLHAEGKLDVSADRKTVEANLKAMKKTHKLEKTAEAKARKKSKLSIKQRLQNRFAAYANSSTDLPAGDNAHFLFDRWMWFGSGFYGLAALWTLAIVEVMDIFKFLVTFPGFAKLFENGVLALIIDFIVNQVTNIFSAFIWFTYWGQGSILTWVLVAYLGYVAGMKFAKYKQAV